MSRLQCVGTSSKVPSKASEAVKPGIIRSRDAPVSKSVQSATRSQIPRLGTQPEGRPSSAVTEGRREKGNVDTVSADPDPEPVSRTPKAQQENGFKKAKHGPSRSETRAGLQALSPGETSTHRQENSATHTAPAGAGIQSRPAPSYLEEEKTVSAECVQKVHEPVVQEPRYLGVPKCGTGRSTMEVESGDEEECEEEDEDAAEVCAPIELLAEFLKALMERKFTLAKKLCQMILIYEPENPEAKRFLPLIEERLLIEAAESSSSERNIFDDDDEDDDDDDDDDDGSSSGSGLDDDTDTSTDSDGDSSCSSSSDREKQDRSQR